MLSIKVNKDKEFEVSTQDCRIRVNGTESFFDLTKIKEGKYSVLLENKSFEIEVLQFEPKEKKISLLVNGKKTETTIKDETDILLEKLGIKTLNPKIFNELKAPMPGLVLKILVDERDEVESGTPLVVLEAMKMENILKSPGKGQVKKILIHEGQTVEKNQVLIEFK